MKRNVMLMGGLLFLVVGFSVFFAERVSAEATYVGSDTCKLCHQAIYDTWKDTYHTKKLRIIAAENVIGDFTQDPVLSDSGKNIPEVTIDLEQNGDTFTATIGGTVYTITHTLGGAGWKQRYITKIGSSLYILPMQWNKATKEWVAYHLNDWYDTSGQAKEIVKKQSYDRRCVGCHTTGTTVTYNENEEWVASWNEMTVSCEACHGPGSEHVAGGGDKTKIVCPNELAPQRANELCGACHSRGSSIGKVGGSTLGYPYGDNGREFRPGDVLADYYTDGGGDWPDGTSKKHHQQWLDFQNSEHWKEAQMRCWDCHEAHGATEIGHDLKVSSDDNTLCLNCHTRFIGKANLTAHTHHNDISTSKGSRCTKCHIPKVAKSAVNYDIHSHTFDFLSPSNGIKNSMPDSCTECHNGTDATLMTQAEADAQVKIWWPEEAAENGYYVLDGFGGIHSLNGAPPLVGNYYGWNIVRDIDVVPDHDGSFLGYVILNGFGGVQALGNATAPSGIPYFGWDIARDILPLENGEYLLLDGFGGIFSTSETPKVEGPYFGWDIAREVVPAITNK